MDTPTTPQPARRGRPPKAEGAQTPAERKRAQRTRDLTALCGSALTLESVTLDGLLTAARRALAEGQRAILADVLKELGHRGGLNVACQSRDRHGKAPKHPKTADGTMKWPKRERAQRLSRSLGVVDI